MNYLPQILQEMRENGQEINVVVIETIQKLRDMTLNDVMKTNLKSQHSMIGRSSNELSHVQINRETSRRIQIPLCHYRS